MLSQAAEAAAAAGADPASEAAQRESILRGVAPSFPSTYYVALVTTEGPTNALAGVEVAGGARRKMLLRLDQ